MFDRNGYFSRLMKGSQGSEEERQCAALLYNDQDLQMGDKRLNSLAALTWNAVSCQKLFAMLEKAIVPTDNPWKDYNSALVKKGFFNQGGTDYGAPVRAASKTIVSILGKDENIRKARQDARGGQAMLVPIGEEFEQTNPSQGIKMSYGQGISSSVGAGFSLEQVPGMYDGRPERYFDRANDPRNRTVTTGDSQITRDKQAPSLLDLVFDTPSSQINPNLPQADYLPALEKQKELERQLAEQQELLRKLQQQQQQQQQQMQPQQQQPLYGTAPQPFQATAHQSAFGQNSSSSSMKSNYQEDLLHLTMTTPSTTAPFYSPSLPSYPTNNSIKVVNPHQTQDLLGFEAPHPSSSSFQSIQQNHYYNSNNNMNSNPATMVGYATTNQPAAPTGGMADSYLENFHQQYQSHSIRYTNSPVSNQPVMQPPAVGSASSDASAQLWSFDHHSGTNNPQSAAAFPYSPPPLPPAASNNNYYNNNYNNPNGYQYPPPVPAPEAPQGPPPPVPHFRP